MLKEKVVPEENRALRSSQHGGKTFYTRAGSNRIEKGIERSIDFGSLPLSRQTHEIESPQHYQVSRFRIESIEVDRYYEIMEGFAEFYCCFGYCGP